ncbi:MAG: FIST N-terminal domain-containing protein [Desulfuromonadales bacterium]
MQTHQVVITTPANIRAELPGPAVIKPNLVLVFAAPVFFEQADFSPILAECFPDSCVVGCSTAGEICHEGVLQNHCVVTAIRFDHTSVVTTSTPLADMADSRDAGRRLAENLCEPALQAVMVFGQGLKINGSALIEGLTDKLGTAIPITGGLAGDNGLFAHTWTIGPEGVSNRAIVAVGLSGDRLQFSHGSFGGWETLGPAQKVTRCQGNVLFELDNGPALPIYKRYLGDYANKLPASGLLFPFAMLGEDRNTVGLIRSILGVNETDGSLILAGEIALHGYLKLMHATTDALVDGADAAAQAVAQMRGQTGRGLAILVSCVGRKLVMGNRVDDEVKAVAAVLGHETTLTGFYSYGEISPIAPEACCKLHNQTMTIVFLAEL